MYIPSELAKPLNIQKPTASQYNTFLNNNLLPIQSLDQNVLFMVNDEEFQFTHVDGVYHPDLAIRISRTSLLAQDPSTYVAISKWVVYNLRKFHNTSGPASQDPITNPVKLPPESEESGTLPFGCTLNPLVSDHFQPVHLTPGCVSCIAEFSELPAPTLTNGTSSSKGLGRLWSRGGGSRTSNSPGPTDTSSSISGMAHVNANLPPSHNARTRSSTLCSSLNSANNSTYRLLESRTNLNPPKSSIMRSGSTYISKVSTTDGVAKKLNAFNSFLISGHGRVLNIVNLSDDHKTMDVEVPLIRVFVNHGVVTCLDHKAYVMSNQRNLDILVGYSTGDILWFNPFKMKYSRFNKKGHLIHEPVMSICWSTDGQFIIAGFSNGEVLFFNRDLEDCDDISQRHNSPNLDNSDTADTDTENELKTSITITNTTPASSTAMASRSVTSPSPSPSPSPAFIRVDVSYKNQSDENPVSHFQLSEKSITSIQQHPLYENLVFFASDDSSIKMVDVLKETVTDIHTSYYGGILSMKITKDGKYLFASSQDDFISVYELLFVTNMSYTCAGSPIHGNLRLVARLEGQASWVRDIQVDCQKSSLGLLYRIGAVGDDGRIVFYEFQPKNLPNVHKQASTHSTYHHHRTQTSKSLAARSPSPPPVANGTFLSIPRKPMHHRHSNSVTSISSQHQSLLGLIKSTSHVSDQRIPPGNASDTAFEASFCCKVNLLTGETPLVHSVRGLRDIPIIQPIGSSDVKLGRLAGLVFQKNYVWVFSAGGDLLRWKRPGEKIDTL
ncbi:hypothetical protein LJB42_004187 [Komagataella kurtzmanii]|nr:hypothetical protein LJB42_004187 [Komagataella kurtzmanii]